MPTLIQGRIVRLKEPRPDPQGGNIKPGRMYIVLNTRASISAGDDLELVAITSSICGKDGEVKLPMSRDPRKGTGLMQESVAACWWTETVEQDGVDISDNFVPGAYLHAVIVKTDEMRT